MKTDYPIVWRRQTEKKYKETELDWKFFRITPDAEHRPLHDVIIEILTGHNLTDVIEIMFVDAVHGFTKTVKA